MTGLEEAEIGCCEGNRTCEFGGVCALPDFGDSEYQRQNAVVFTAYKMLGNVFYDEQHLVVPMSPATRAELQALTDSFYSGGYKLAAKEEEKLSLILQQLQQKQQ